MSFEANPAPVQPQSVQQSLPLPLGRPFWVYAILAIIAIVFVIESLFPVLAPVLIPFLNVDDFVTVFPRLPLPLTPAHFEGGSTNNLVLVAMGANVRPLVEQGQIWRFFTSMFVHIGISHLLFNAYALFIFGIEMERVYGGPRFLVIYILSGLFGSLASFALGNALISAGASGAIFGVIGIQVAYFFRHKDILGKFSQSRLMNAAIIVGINLVFGLQPGIDNLAHIGGLLGGIALGYLMAPRYEIVDEYTPYPRVIDESTLMTQLWVPLAAVGLLAVGTFALVGLPG